MNKMDEIIIVVNRNTLFENEKLTWQGNNTDEKTIARILDNIDKNYQAMRRGNAEVDFSYKQPIPYIVLRKGDKLYCYERLNGGGEKRLYNKLSLGVGGHANPDFSDLGKPFAELISENTIRELEEELNLNFKVTGDDIEIISLINDDSEEVSRVHIALLGIIDLDEDDEVSIRETDQLRGFWISVSELLEPETYNRLENWSQIVVDNI